MIRHAQYAGSFYSNQRDVLTAHITEYFNGVMEQPKLGKIEALIVPHAGYIYSGLTAAHAYSLIKNNSYDDVIVLGPSHRVCFEGFGLGSATTWESPLGVTPISSRVAERASQSGYVVVDEAHQFEHSLEVQLPFLQKALSAFSLFPIITGTLTDFEWAVAEIDLLKRENDLLILSSDLSHFHTYEAARQRDVQTLAQVVAGDSTFASSAACGGVGIKIALALAKKNRWQCKLLDYRNSGDTAGDRDRVVGYGALVFYREEPNVSV